ncbi:g470 [Coccomyxa elongata]
MEGVGESRGISEEVLASLREGVVSHELYNDIQERDRHEEERAEGHGECVAELGFGGHGDSAATLWLEEVLEEGPEELGLFDGEVCVRLVGGLDELLCKPQDYWPAMLRMTEALEQNGKRIRNFCPLRTSAVPRHITLDTTTLVHLLYTEEFGKKSRLLTKGELVRNKEMIWGTFFRTNMKAFETRDYRFNHMVNTDGVSCSVLLIRRDLYGKKCSRGKPAVVASEEYVDDLSSDARKSLRIRKVVGIDPNMSDLLYCVNEDASHHYRYTQNQRRRETKANKYREIVLKERNHTRIQGRTVAEWESDLSAHNHKLVDKAAAEVPGDFWRPR